MWNSKPQLKIYSYINNSFVLQAIIDDYKSCSWNRSKYSAGNFTIEINYNIPNALLFERGLFIQFGSDHYDFGEILSICDKIMQDGKGSQIRTITGYDAKYILKRRIIKNLNSNGMWKMTAKGELCLRNLIADQCGVNAETKRQLPIINTIPQESDAIGKEYSVSEQFTNLYEVCKTIATQSEIGWRVKFESGNLTLECFEGIDRSDTVQFSTDFDSLRDGEFSDSSESYSNAIYIGGKGQNDERDIYEGEDGTPNGLDRFEAWDDQSQMTTTDEYTAEALSMLTQYGQTVNVSGNGLAKCPYVYKEQYDVGDIITIAFSGKTAKVQILSVTERWALNQYDINFSFGKPQNNLADQLQLMLRKIQSASDKTNATESVKWYTMPTVTSMPADDVTFNTIGFTGTLTANSTFTLYRDSEGTGAKSYNVYCKNLSGNYTLTLTTGVSGASNFTIKGGSNIVARILVDENGNIVSQSMTATDTIESGNNQPTTSSGVANALEGKVNTDTYTNTNLNTLINTGFYSVGYSGNWQDYNFPTGHYGTVLVGVTPSNNLMQMFMSDDNQLVYVRNCTNNVWSSWKKVLNTDDVTDTIESGNNQPASSDGVANAVAESMKNISHFFPIKLEKSITSSASWRLILWVGDGYLDRYNASPNISGRTKKVRLGMILMTAGNNGISVLIKRRDNEEIVVVDNLVVWGGCDDSSFSRLVYVTIDPSFLDAYSTFHIKSSQEGYDVAVGCIFAEIYYE